MKLGASLTHKSRTLLLWIACFAGLTYLSLWMAGKMHIFDRRGYSLKPIIVLVPILGKNSLLVNTHLNGVLDALSPPPPL